MVPFETLPLGFFFCVRLGFVRGFVSGSFGFFLPSIRVRLVVRLEIRLDFNVATSGIRFNASSVNTFHKYHSNVCVVRVCECVFVIVCVCVC